MVRVSGVPYEVDMKKECSGCKELMSTVEYLRQENKMLRDKVNKLTEECNWLEAKTREVKQSTQGEH